MKIESILLQSFRRFSEPLLLDKLAVGINLFAAPNESGKSTVAEAIRAAFLENHKTGKVEQLLPWGQDGASPSVKIDFTAGSRKATLEKSFNKKKACFLVIEGEGKLQSEEAERRLSQLLGFTVTERGPSRPENHGIPGLLWVEQGASPSIADPVGHAQKSLRDALGGSLGELAASAGDRVIKQVETDLAQLKTLKSNASTGDLAKAEQRVQDLQARVAQLAADVQNYNASVDKLATLKAEVDKAETEKPWDGLRNQAAQKQTSLDALASVERELLAKREQHDQSTVQAAYLLKQLEAFQKDEEAVQKRQAELVRANEEDVSTLERFQALEAELASAKDRDVLARSRSEIARRADRRRTLGDALAAARQRSDELEASVGKVLGLVKDLAAAREAEGRLAGFEGAAEQLRKCEAKWQTAQARLEAITTRVDYDFTPEADVTVGGEPVAGQGQRKLAEPVTIAIRGVGTIQISPGAEDIAERGAQAQRLHSEFQALLQKFGVESIAAAQTKERELADARGQVKNVQSVIDAIAPKGLPILEAEKARLDGEVQAHQAALAAMPSAEGEAQAMSVADAEAEEKESLRGLTSVQERFQDARNRATAARHSVETATRELEAAQAILASEDRTKRLGDCHSRLAETRGQQATLSTRIEALNTQLREANPEQLRQDVARLTTSAEALYRKHQEQRSALNWLESELATKGALGLREELDEQSGLLQREEAAVAEKERRAAALRLLLDMLLAKRQDLARRMRAPLQKHLNRYLEMLFPGSSMELDDDLKPTMIQRVGANGRESGHFAELSMGAREQLGIISRLAYADLLKEAGKPTLLILDDSLVNSDEVRLEKMKQVLFDAQKRHQIFVFTCHPNLWQDIGVAARGLV